MDDQICRALATEPPTLKAFFEELCKNNYTEMQSLWRREQADKEEADMQTETIQLVLFLFLVGK